MYLPSTLAATRLSSISMSAPIITIGKVLRTPMLASAKASRFPGAVEEGAGTFDPLMVILPPSPWAFRKMDPGAERSAGSIKARASNDSLMVPVASSSSPSCLACASTSCCWLL